MVSSTLMDDMAEKHNGMFGQVVKKSIRKLFPNLTNGTVISLIFLTTAHNNASFAIAKETVNNYDL